MGKRKGCSPEEEARRAKIRELLLSTTRPVEPMLVPLLNSVDRMPVPSPAARRLPR